MAFTYIPEYSLTAGTNTDVAGINCAEGWPAGNINACLRAQLAQEKQELAYLDTVASAATVDISASGAYTVSGTTGITAFTVVSGSRRRLIFSGALTITHDGDAIILPGNASITTVAGDCLDLVAHDTNKVTVTQYTPDDGTYAAWRNAATVTAASGDLIPIKDVSDSNAPKFVTADTLTSLSRALTRRQTIMSGPVTSDGLPNFGGSTGSGTVTMTGTLIATAANGFSSSGQADRVGSITDASWTGLTTDGTMYLYLDIAADGTATTGSGTLAPIYQFGGTPSTTSGQFTFNISQMTAYVGNGSAAPATYRVYVGQVTVASNVVSAITWYALNGRYVAPWTATLFNASTTASFSHNLGLIPIYVSFEVECTSAEQGYAVGERTFDMYTFDSVTAVLPPFAKTATTATTVNSANDWRIRNISTGALALVTKASWKYRAIVDRGF